jgi:hypothetical protein
MVDDETTQGDRRVLARLQTDYVDLYQYWRCSSRPTRPRASAGGRPPSCPSRASTRGCAPRGARAPCPRARGWESPSSPTTRSMRGPLSVAPRSLARLDTTLGLAFGLFNGCVTVFGRIPSFIVTLGTLSVGSGLALSYQQGTPDPLRALHQLVRRRVVRAGARAARLRRDHLRDHVVPPALDPPGRPDLRHRRQRGSGAARGGADEARQDRRADHLRRVLRASRAYSARRASAPRFPSSEWGSSSMRSPRPSSAVRASPVGTAWQSARSWGRR